jgi:dienelactone hydrolase
MRRGTSKTFGIIAVGLVCLLTAACVPMLTPPPKPPPSTLGPNPDDAPQAGVAAYASTGPYDVGVLTVEIEYRRFAEIWYPAAPGSTVGLTPESYRIKDFLSDFLRFLLPPGVDPVTPTIAYRGVPAATGTFPLVLFSHGASSYRLQSTQLTTHLASWGFVVISPDYVERGLQSLLGDPQVTARSDEFVANLAVEKMIELNSTPGGVLEGRVDTSRLFPIGHSAGGNQSTRLASNRTDVESWIVMSAGYDPTRTFLPAAMADPQKSAMWIIGANDGVASPSGARTGFEYTAGPRKLVVIPGAGHNNAFTDICEIARDQGGVVGLALSVGLPIPDFVANLGRDGCIVPPNELSPVVWPVVHHFVTAELRFRAGLDPEPVGLGSAVVSQFAVAPTYEHNP